MRHFRLQDCLPGILAAGGYRADAADTALFLRDLTFIYEQSYDIKYIQNKARMIIPVDTRVPPGAESYVWRQFDGFGTVKFGDMSAEDMPNVEVSGREFQNRIYSVTGSYQYSIQEMRAASMAGIPLETRKAETVRRAFENAVEVVAVFGSAGAGLLDAQGRSALQGFPTTVNASDPIPMYGFANAPDIINAAVADSSVNYGGPVTVSSSGFQTGLDWTLDSTPVTAILGDLNAMQRAIFNKSGGLHEPETLLLPTAIFSKLGTQARSSTFTTDSILQYVQTQSPWIKEIMHWPTLNFAGLKQDNATAGPRVMLCERRPENFSMVIPQEFEQMPPQLVNFVFRIPCHMRLGGVKMPYPKSVCFLDGAAG